jgi:hypothetical protein
MINNKKYCTLNYITFFNYKNSYLISFGLKSKINKYNANYSTDSKPTSWLDKLINKNRKNILGRFLIGAHKGLTIKTLPQNMLDFQLNPAIRVLRVLGGISLLLIVGRSYIQLTGIYLYIVTFLLFIYLIYQIYISYHRIKHIIKILKSDKLDIYITPFLVFTLKPRVKPCSKPYGREEGRGI